MEIKDKTAIIKTLDDVLNRQVTSQEIQRAMDSKLLQGCIIALRSSNDTARRAQEHLSVGSMIHEFAKARLGIDNKFEPTAFFYNSWEYIEECIRVAKEKGLDSAITDKYDFRYGSDDIRRIMEHPETIYDEKEMEAIGLSLHPKNFEEFKQAVRSLSESKQISAEEERIKHFNNGEAVIKAFVLYDIATRRLRATHEKDENFYKVKHSLTTPDNPRRWNYQNIKDPDHFELKEGESIKTKYILRSDIAKQMMHMIATSPITERFPLLESKNHISQERDTSKATVRNNEVQPPKGWAAILSSHNDKKSSVSTYCRESVAVGKNSAPAPQADTEQALHDNFEELMKEQGKHDYNKGLHK